MNTIGDYELNRIYCEDGLDGVKKLPDKSIDAVITDPPYALGVTHNGKKGEYADLAIMKPFFESLFFQYSRILKPEGAMYICCDWRTYPFLYPIAVQFLNVRNLLVWNKGFGRVSKYYAFSHELVIYAAEKENIKSCTERSIIDCDGYSSRAKCTNGVKIHPTQKPVELFEKFIGISTDEGGIVLDTFMGSGTTAVAAMNLHRQYIGFEIQQKYVNLAEERIAHRQGNMEITIENMQQAQTLFSAK